MGTTQSFLEMPSFALGPEPVRGLGPERGLGSGLGPERTRLFVQPELAEAS
jgi:hypothetical protein